MMMPVVVLVVPVMVTVVICLVVMVSVMAAVVVCVMVSVIMSVKGSCGMEATVINRKHCHYSRMQESILDEYFFVQEASR